MKSRLIGAKYPFHHSLLATLFSPFLSNTFDSKLEKQIGKNYVCFYSGRSGIYHLLMYLKKFGASRIHLSRNFNHMGQSVPFVSGKAEYEVIFYDDKPKNIKKNDVILIPENFNIELPDNVFTIQDSASQIMPPIKRYDFTLYSFNQNKPLTAAGGGVIVVNNPRFNSFLDISSKLEKPTHNMEFHAYINAVSWKIMSYKWLRSIARKSVVAMKGENGITPPAIWDSTGKFKYIEYAMPDVSKRLASRYMPIDRSRDVYWFQFPHSLLTTLLTPILPDKFDELLSKQIGKNYATFYHARNGIYKILNYLNRNYGSTRVFLPHDICGVVRLVSEKANYKIIYYKERPTGMKKNDVVLLTDSSIPLPEDVFSIQDNAKTGGWPVEDYDFTVYSLNLDKPLSSGGGGIILVNNKKLLSFLSDSAVKVKRPDSNEDKRSYINSIKWKMHSYHTYQNVGRFILRARYGEKYKTMNPFDPSDKFVNLDYDMSTYSRKLASDHLVIGE